MKFPRLIGGLAVGFGVSYVLFSKSIDDRITRNREKDLLVGDLDKQHITPELKSLIKERIQKNIEYSKMKKEWERQFSEENKSHTEKEKENKMIAASADYFIVVIKKHLENMDIELEWLKNAVHRINELSINEFEDKSGDWIDSSR